MATIVSAVVSNSGETALQPGVVSAASHAPGDGVTDAASGISSAIAAASVGDVIDLGNRTYLLGSTINLTKVVTIRNGAFTASGRRCFTVSAAARFERVSFTRTSTAGSDEGSAVYVQAANFTSVDCTYTSAAGPTLYLKHASANGAVIKGGYCYPQRASQDVGGIYVAAGGTGNFDILVDGVTVQGNGSSTMGMNFYDSARCSVRNCVIDTATQMPDIVHTSGWALVSGNVYSRADRTDGVTRVILNGVTELTEDTSTPTAPGANTWGVNGGALYVNLNGTNPNTVSITSRIVSGYGLMFYSTQNGFTATADNEAVGNRIRNCDGFGIYYQFGTAGTTARRNSTRGNKLNSVCLKGVQSNKLPFAGFGCIGGFDSSFTGDQIDTVGTVSFPAPAFRVNPVSTDSSGVVTGMQVRGATKSGITLPSGKWKFVGCRSTGNTGSGFEAHNGQSTDIVDAELVGCESTGNTVHGVLADASVIAGSNYRVSIVGGLYHTNPVRNIVLKSARDSKIVGATCYSPGSGQYNIQIDSGCQRIVVDDCSIAGGNGVSVNASATDVVVGKTTQATGSTPFSLGVPVRVGGSLNAAAAYTGTGTPEAVVTAVVGSSYLRLDGGTGTTFYVKETGSSNTGWVAK